MPTLALSNYWKVVHQQQLLRSLEGVASSSPSSLPSPPSSSAPFATSLNSSLGRCHSSTSLRKQNARSLCLSSVSEAEDMSARRFDVVDQGPGPDMADSISSDTVGQTVGAGSGTPQMTPKHQMRQQQQQQQPLLPVAGQVLLDPTTGQHFIVPQAGGPQPIYYQPVYYGPPPTGHPAPAQVPPQGYYAYPPQHIQGYAMAPLPHFSSRFASFPAQQPPPQQRPATGPACYQQAACSTDDLTRNMEDGSMVGPPPGSPHYGKGGVTSFAASYHSAQGQQQQRPSPPSSQPEDPENGRDPFRRDLTRSSGEYARVSPGDSGYGSRFGPAQGHHSLGSLPSTPGSAPIMQHAEQPQWWMRQQQQPRQRPFTAGMDTASLTDVESSSRTRPSHSPPAVSTVSDTEASSRQYAPPFFVPHHPQQPVQPQEEAPPPAPKPKAIRMEIDLAKPMPEEEELRRAEEEKTKAKVNRAPPTAFTVTFDGEDGAVSGQGVRARPPISLQDAARRGRMARRGGGNAPVQSPAPPAQPVPSKTVKGTSQQQPPHSDSADDKGFLLDRLLHGEKSRPATADAVPSASSSAGHQHKQPQKDADNQSDAGTYVIGESEARNHSTLMTSQIIEKDSDASSTDTETTESRSPSPVDRRRVQERAESNRALLTELARLKENNRAAPSLSPRGAPSSSTVPSSSSTPKARQTLMSTPANRSVFGQAATSAGLIHRNTGLPTVPPSGYSNHHSPAAPATTSPPSTTSSSSSTFRRADGGRFSMRTGAGAVVAAAAPGGSPQHQPKRPPWQVAGKTPTPGPTERQREVKMNAWLLRKDYNPMRAAQEAKKAAALKSRGDQFTSNRSISFHVGNAPVPQGRMSHRGCDLSRNKSSESLTATAEDEARSHASQRVIAEYSRGVVQDINKLTKQHSRTKDEKELSGLAKAVDMLSTKCKKSIELIRAQNKGCLSVSVEDLLATAVEPPRDDESLTDQLDRLSQAFDAVQRYLEQYSLDEREEDSAGEEKDEFSLSAGASKKGPSSTFSSLSAYRTSGRGTGIGTGMTSSSNRSTVSAFSRPARTTAYRAQLLATQRRSPSGGRPAKNN